MNKQELRNWIDNLTRDIKVLREAVEADDIDGIFESFNDAEHDFSKLSEQIDAIDIPEAGPPYDAATATGMYDRGDA